MPRALWGTPRALLIARKNEKGKSMRRLTATLGLIAALPAARAAPPTGPFLCIVEQATGFAFDRQSKSWHAANFRAGHKLIVKRTDRALSERVPMLEVGAWAVWDFGDDSEPEYQCGSEFSEVGVLWCEGTRVLDALFGLNIRSHRFITDSPYGYIQAGLPGYLGVDGKPLPEGSNTPSIEIGTCASL